MSFSNVVLTGTYFAPEGGAVQFQLDQTMMQPGGLIVAPSVHQVTIAIGSASTFSITLQATNDPATIPQGTAYQVTEQMATAPANIYWIVLPYNATGGTVDITECPRVVPTPYPIQSFVLASELGVPGGFATLDSTGNVPFSELGNITSGGSGVDMPLAGGVFTGPTLYEYAGSATTAINSIELTTDSYPRYVQLAGASVQNASPYAPTSWGTHVSGNVGSGSDFQWGMESLSDTGHMMFLSFPRVHLTDGTHYLQLANFENFPLSGSPNVLVTSTTGLASSGTLTVSSVFYGSGTISYTSIVNSTTLGGCTSTGLTAQTDTSARNAIWLTDSFGAPIWWIADYGGMYLNDQYNVAANDVYADYFNDITLGFATSSSGTETRSPLTGWVASTTPIQAITALQFGRNSATGGSGSNGWTSGAPTFALSISRFNDAYSNGYLIFEVGGGPAGNNSWHVGPSQIYSTTAAALGAVLAPISNIYLSNGSAALPAYTFADQTSGFFNNPSLGISAIGVSLGGTEVFQINPGAMSPITDDAYWLGATSKRWAQIHAVQYFGANGSATVPSFTFDNDTETGFYRVSAGVMGVTIAGTAIGNFSSSGWSGSSGGSTTASSLYLAQTFR